MGNSLKTPLAALKAMPVGFCRVDPETTYDISNCGHGFKANLINGGQPGYDGHLQLSYSNPEGCSFSYTIAPDGQITGGTDSVRNPNKLYSDALMILKDPEFQKFLESKYPHMTADAIKQQIKTLEDSITKRDPTAQPTVFTSCLSS